MEPRQELINHQVGILQKIVYITFTRVVPGSVNEIYVWKNCRKWYVVAQVGRRRFVDRDLYPPWTTSFRNYSVVEQ